MLACLTVVIFVRRMQTMVMRKRVIGFFWTGASISVYQATGGEEWMLWAELDSAGFYTRQIEGCGPKFRCFLALRTRLNWSSRGYPNCLCLSDFT